MLHPDQFEVNEAWIAFKLNGQPLHTEQDGDFDFYALMDAASCFILGSQTVSADNAEPGQLDSRRLLQQAYEHKEQWPATLFVPREQTAARLVAEAEKLGIHVIRVPDAQLLPFTGEARQGFRERFG